MLFSCQSDSSDKSEQPSDKIVIGERFSFFSNTLNEDRELLISLPSNYDRNIHDYPVITVMDAEYLFEITSAIVKIKTSRNEMPESIVVGIPNNTGKRYEMALQLRKNDGQKFFGDNGGNAKEYLTFFRKELFPYLEKNYRVNADKTIIGMSPTFGPVLEAFWNEPDLFSGYIVLAAELSLTTVSNKTVAEKVLASIQDSLHPKASIYVGKAAKDLERRPEEERKAFIQLNHKLDSTSNPNPKINYSFQILDDEDHYGMSVTGIQQGLKTIYSSQMWNVPYRDFWNSKNPANEIKSFYDKLSDHYGFEIVPLEDSFYSSNTLLGTIRRLKRQEREKERTDVINLALEYYPNSRELSRLRSTIK